MKHRVSACMLGTLHDEGTTINLLTDVRQGRTPVREAQKIVLSNSRLRSKVRDNGEDL